MTALPVIADSLQQYFIEINRYPILTREEETSLAMKYSKEGDIESAHKLVTSNLRFVVKIANEFRGYGLPFKDLIQEGNLGLMTAVKKYDVDKGFRVITYASWWIKSFIQDYIVKSKGLVKRGTKALKKQLFSRSAGEEYISTNDLSLNVAVGDSDDITHLDMLVDDSLEAGDELEVAETKHHLAKTVSGALAVLNDREKYIVRERIMAENPMSLQELGDKFSLSRERVRQIESGAIEKLKDKLS